MPKKLITLDELSRYDGKIKDYVDDNLPLDSKMVYVGKISEYDTAAKALDVANYPIGTRIILKHDGAKHTVFIKNTNRNTNAIEVELGDGAAYYVPIDNIYYFDRNNEGTTAITSTRAFCHGPVVTEWKQVKHPENDVPYIAASGQELVVRAPFRIEEDSNGDLNTSTLSDYTKIQRIGIQKTYPQQRMDVMYIDKDLNKYNMIIVEHSSSSEVLEGTCVSTRPLADGYYHNLKIQLTITIDSTTSEYSSYTKTITDLGPIIQTQFTTMPTADSTTVGQVVQYIGTTDSNYTNGYFYIGVTDGEETPTYSWENINVQSASSGSEIRIIDVATEATGTNPFIIDEHEIGDYYLKSSSDTNWAAFCIKYSNQDTPTNIMEAITPIMLANDKYKLYKITLVDNTPNTGTNPKMIIRGEDGIDVSSSLNNMYIKHITKCVYATSNNSLLIGNINGLSSNVTNLLVTNDTVQTISGKKTFTTLPESSITPTTANQLVNKAYVDEIAEPTQVTALPSASSDNLDKIYQYIGPTNSIYTNGYFYKCMYDGDDYYWESISVQANVVDTTGAQTISGVKTFSTLPQSSVVPTNNNDLVNKNYVDTSIIDLTSAVETIATDSDIDSLFE